jgi:YaiO family outer membrane protein
MFVWVWVGAVQAIHPIESEPLMQARQALSRGELSAALELAERALNEDFTQVEWRLLRAELHAAHGELLKAVALAGAIGRDHPEDRRGRLLEARWLAHLGRLPSAQARYEALLEETPEDRDLQALLAQTFAWRGDWDGASDRFEAVLKEEPYHEVAFLANLRVLLGAGQASAAWQRGRQRDRETGQQDPELGLFLARLVARVGAVEQADSLASRPTSDPGLLQQQTAFRAVQTMRAGDWGQGQQLLEQLRRHVPVTFDSLMEAANAHAAADQVSIARELYGQALALTPERPEAHLGLARLASREGRLAGSLAMYRKVTLRSPEAIEGWLGMAYIARLLNDAAVLQTALQGAWRCAPRSALLHQEQLRMLLLDGDSARFAEAIARYREDQPLDRYGQLWELRWRRAQQDGSFHYQVLALLDPLEPELASQGLALLQSVYHDPAKVLEQLPDVPDAMLKPLARTAVAQRLAVSLQPELAGQLVGGVGAAAERWIDIVSGAWWAYLSAPLAIEPLLEESLDAQARTVWLADQVQRRLQTLAIETESLLSDEWFLQRALWFGRWRGQWASEKAAADLRIRILGLVPGWSAGLQLAQIDDAWRRSEQALPAVYDTAPQLLVRARWRRFRFDYEGALQLLHRLQASYPAAADPRFAQIDTLRASGRLSEAAILLGQWSKADGCPPLVRLHYIELLRRSGRFSDAARELEHLQGEGFGEPEYFRQQVLLALAAARPDEAHRWLEAGLAEHSDIAELVLLEVDRLRRSGKGAELAALLDRSRPPTWVTPGVLADAWPYMGAEARDRLLHSASWWFRWHWLSWTRLERGSLSALEEPWRNAATGHDESTLQQVLPALRAGIPDSDLWLHAGRLYDLEGQAADSTRAYHIAGLLGVGRPDAAISGLSQLATRRPIDAAREFARRLDSQPDDPGLRKGLVLALLRAGEVTAAERALAPLLEAAPDDAEVVMLAAQVRAAMGRVRQARSLYQSLLRDDPLHADARAGRLALRDIGEWGAAVAYEYAALSDTTGSGADLDDWHEATLSLFWRRPMRQTWGLEYRWIERHHDQAQELVLDAAQGLDRNWIVRVHGGIGLSGSLVPTVRAGGGVRYRFHDNWFAGLDLRYLHFRTVDVIQVIPASTWRWHPRGTLEGRVYISQNLIEDGSRVAGLTALVQTSWRFAGPHSVAVHYAIGTDNSFDPVPGLIANDSFQSVGVHLRLEGLGSWTVHPAYRYEAHQRFELHAVGLAASMRF